MGRDFFARLLRYDAATGKLTWLVDPPRGPKTLGCEAGTVTRYGYRAVKIEGVRYQAHRLAWLLSYGEWPVADVDHRNGKRSDNRLKNLRSATRLQNCANRGLNKNNSTGAIGVTFRRGRYEARLGKAWGRMWLGTFHTLEQAKAAYAAAAERLNGEFRRGGVTSGT